MCSRHEQLRYVIGIGRQWATTNVRQKATVVYEVRGSRSDVSLCKTLQWPRSAAMAPEIWRPPQNQKFVPVTYCNCATGGLMPRSQAYVWRIWWCLDAWFYRYACRHTNTLITILRSQIYLSRTDAISNHYIYACLEQFVTDIMTSSIFDTGLFSKPTCFSLFFVVCS